MKLFFFETQIDCDKAIKNESDGTVMAYFDGSLVASYFGVSDFSAFSLIDGGWSEPEPSPQEQTDTLMLDHEERLIYLELGVNDNAVSGS